MGMFNRIGERARNVRATRRGFEKTPFYTVRGFPVYTNSNGTMKTANGTTVYPLSNNGKVYSTVNPRNTNLFKNYKAVLSIKNKSKFNMKENLNRILNNGNFRRTGNRMRALYKTNIPKSVVNGLNYYSIIRQRRGAAR